MCEAKDALRALIQGADLTQADAARLLYVSPDGMRAWLKPATSRSAVPAPRWAIELLAYKTGQAVPPGGTEAPPRLRPEPAPATVA